MEVGIRELRNNLSRLLKRVRNGEELVITDRGRAVARLTALEEERPIDRLVAEGVVTAPSQAKRAAPGERETPDGPVSELVTDQRR